MNLGASNLGDFADLVTLSSIRLGSVVIDGGATPSNVSPSQVLAASNSISSGLSSTSTIGNLNVGSVSVVATGVN